MSGSIDVCLTAFSCSTAAPCQQWAKDYFAEPPVVGWVPGANSSQFESSGVAAATDILGYAAQRAKCGKADVRRIALVTFSAGWGFCYRVLQDTQTAAMVDAVILLDGMHTMDLGAMKLYADRAALGAQQSPWLVMAHSQIVPPYVSTRTTNTIIMDATAELALVGASVSPPDYVTHAAIDHPPLTLGNQYGKRTFTHDTLGLHDERGNCWRLEYQGDSAADHIYIATQVQPRLWRWLGERWNDPTVGVLVNP